MGIGSSKQAQQEQPQPVVAPYYAPPTIGTTKRSRHQSAQASTSARTRYDSYNNTPLARSQSTKSAHPHVGTAELRDKRGHRAYASEDGRFHFDPVYAQQNVHPLRNPLPTPPRDIFAPSPIFDTFEPPLSNPLPTPPMASYPQVGPSQPPPFIPISEEELRRRKKQSLKDKSRGYGQDGGKAVPVHRVDPSSSLSSHSSVSTTHPPAQVVTPNYAMFHNVGDPRLTGNAKSKPRKRGFLSSLLPSFSSSPPKESTMLTVWPAGKSHQPANSNTPHISHPHMLAPRVVQPPPPPIVFYHPDEPYYGFTTFSPHKILYRKQLYHTAEHLYQAIKFLPERGSNEGDPDAAEHIRTYSEHPADAVMQGRLLSKKARPNWKAMRSVWMDHILYLKFTQHLDIRNQLISTAPAELIFVSPADAYWGVGEDGTGRNELGLALVRVRTRIIRELEQ